MKRTTAIDAAIVGLAFAASLVFFPELPRRMAIHWDASGTADDFASKAVGAFLIPALSVLVFALFRIVPRIDPLGESFDRFRSAYEGFVTVFLLFLLYVHGLVLAVNLDYVTDITGAILPAVGVLLYAAGIVLENAERNWFVGIRTPWTLSSDEVWERTHELGGPLFKLSGVIAVFGVLVPEYAMYLVVGPIVATAVVTTVYSYYAYRRVETDADAMST